MMKKQPPRQASPVEPAARVRLTYTTGGAIRYTGNLDLHRIWERAFRRAGLPVSYSNGFHPQPRLQLACALPLGMVSRFELADLWLDQALSPREVMDGLNASLPAGVRITKVDMVDPREKPLQTRIHSAEYRITLSPSPSREWLETKMSLLLSKEEIQRERRGKMYNLRPLIQKLEIGNLEERPGQQALFMVLSAREGATGRPEEVLAEMGLDPLDSFIERTALFYI